MSGDDLLVLAEMAEAESDPMAKMMLAAAAQAKELARTKRLAEQNAQRLAKVEADVNQLVFHNDAYCTVIGFCRLIGRRNVNRKQAADYGRQLRRLAQDERFDNASQEVFDPLYGAINAWHLDLLNLFFGTAVPRPYGGGSIR